MKEEYLKSVQTMDDIIKTSYACIGGEPGEERDWEFYRFLFHPDGKLISYENDTNGNMRPQFLSPDEYISRIGKWMETKRKTGFYEREIGRVEERYGNIAHCISTCESFHSLEDMEAGNSYVKNVHSIQLAYYKERWWILSMYWQRASDEFPIPDKYLQYSE
ncbi:hypothetical protein LVD13_05660 [Flavobacteriaceae bacterium D16]|nr:hypothetical protein [Flavobacteriaceae bacterium D16]